MKSFGSYYQLTKPGIIYGNSFALIGAYLYGSRGYIDLVFLMTLLGSALVIAAACVGNNILEASSDKAMERTKQRPLVTGVISPMSARIYMIILLNFGVGILATFTNIYAVFAALIGYFSYVFIYTPIKRLTYHSTLVGALPGAMPPIIGYTAATGKVDVAAFLFFLAMIFWQMPHFYAIAVRRRDDYAAAELPTIVSTKGLDSAINSSVGYGWLFLVAVIIMTITLELSIIFWLVPFSAMCWIFMMYKYRKETMNWAKRVFSFSLLILILWSGLIAFEGFIR